MPGNTHPWFSYATTMTSGGKNMFGNQLMEEDLLVLEQV
jgi:hypothetical protein